MPRGHPGTAAKPPVSVSDKEPGEKRKLKPRGKPQETATAAGPRARPIRSIATCGKPI
jgi:hypothetical protein